MPKTYILVFVGKKYRKISLKDIKKVAILRKSRVPIIPPF